MDGISTSPRPQLARRRSSESHTSNLSSDSIPERPSTTPPPPPGANDEAGQQENTDTPSLHHAEDDDAQYIITMTSGSDVSSSPSLPSPLPPIGSPSLTPSSPLVLPDTVLHPQKAMTPLNVKKRVMHATTALMTPPDSSSRAQATTHHTLQQQMQKAKVPSNVSASVSSCSIDQNHEERLAALNIQDDPRGLDRGFDEGSSSPSFSPASATQEQEQHGQDQRPRFFSQYTRSPTKSSLPKPSYSSPDPFYNPNNTTNVYINGLAPFFKMEELARLASEFGKVLTCRVFHRFNQTKPNGGGQQQGSTYAFVLYETLEDATRCITALRKYSDLHPSFARTQRLPGARGSQPTTAAGLLDKNRPAYQGSPGRVSGTSPSTLLPAAFVGQPETVIEDAVELLIQGLPATADTEIVESLLRPHRALSIRLLPIGTELSRDGRKIAHVRLTSHEAANETFQRLHLRGVCGWKDPDGGNAAESVKLQVTIINPLGSAMPSNQQSRDQNPRTGMVMRQRGVSMPMGTSSFTRSTTNDPYHLPDEPQSLPAYGTSAYRPLRQPQVSPYPQSQLRHHLQPPVNQQSQPRGPPVSPYSQVDGLALSSPFSPPYHPQARTGAQLHRSFPIDQHVTVAMNPRLQLQTATPFMSRERAFAQQHQQQQLTALAAASQMRSVSGMPFRQPFSPDAFPTHRSSSSYHQTSSYINQPQRPRTLPTFNTSPHGSPEGETQERLHTAQATHLQVGGRAIPMRVNDPSSPNNHQNQYQHLRRHRSQAFAGECPSIPHEVRVDGTMPSPALGRGARTASTSESQIPTTPASAGQERHRDGGQVEREWTSGEENFASASATASVSVAATGQRLPKPMLAGKGWRGRRRASKAVAP
ncbi:hypothetical protein FRB95_011073 [Tulasnella sp. JGI-2019a]|nr:hypothetical protein FRB95_011073 [Tulasnella sp. JGI-2019a]